MAARRRKSAVPAVLDQTGIPFDPTTTIPVAELAPLGVRAFTTSRASGTFRLDGHDAAGSVVARWHALHGGLATSRLASARQVHGADVAMHLGGWRGWLRRDGVDGHVTNTARTALAVTIADCVPVFLAAPRGPVGLLHAGWRGTVAGILARGVEHIVALGTTVADLHVHFGPAICGRCYEVSPEVYHQLTGATVTAPTRVDLRAVLMRQAGALGLRHVTQSPLCTKCDGARLFSHRAGDAGRLVSVIVRDPEPT